VQTRFYASCCKNLLENKVQDLSLASFLFAVIDRMEDVEFESWLNTVRSVYLRLTSHQRRRVLFTLSDSCTPGEVADLCRNLGSNFKLDFISHLPAELVEHVLSFFDHRTALLACCVSKLCL
jgi:hypothetical protein